MFHLRVWTLIFFTSHLQSLENWGTDFYWERHSCSNWPYNEIFYQSEGAKLLFLAFLIPLLNIN